MVTKIQDMDKKRSSLSKEVKELKAQLATKASNEAIIDGQQAFFEDLNKVEAQVDQKRDEFIIGEFKRLGDKIVCETTDLYTKLAALEKRTSEASLK